jgi:phenylacetate-CoA ligase
MRSRLAAQLAAQAMPTFAASHLSRDAVQSLALRRLRRMLVSAVRTPFNRGRILSAGIDERGLRDPARTLEALQALEPVTKADYRAAGDGVFLDGRARPDWYSSASSGSTGEPFHTYYDARAWALLRYLIKVRSKFACGMRVTDRVAVVDTFGPDEATPTTSAPGGRLVKLDLRTPMETLIGQMASFRPDVLSGLPSALLEVGMLLDRATAEHVRLVFTTGELLLPHTLQILQRAYGRCRAFDVFGCSETKEIAWECLEGGLHVNADVVLVEILDSAGRSLPEGREGDIVVTLLVNRAMPFLRYRMGDRGRLGTSECVCGRATPMLDVLSGRESETLVLAGGRRLSPLVITTEMKAIPGIHRYQVVQLEETRLRARLMVERSAARDEIEVGVRDALERVLLNPVSIEVEFVDRFERDRHGKFHVVVPLRD